MRSLILAVVLSGAAAVAADAAQSIDVEQVPGKKSGTVLYYAAKFVCGELPTATHPGLVKGSYQTAINVHNPNAEAVRIRKHAVIANTEAAPRGKISGALVDTLKPDEAIEVDCAVVGKLFDISVVNEKGFIVIQTPANRPLDVVGVYTADGG